LAFASEQSLIKSANFFSYPGGVFISSFLPVYEIRVWQKQFLARLYSRPRKKYHEHRVPANRFTVQMTFMVKLFMDEFQMPHLLKSAVTNARFTSLHGLPVALLPFDDARSTTQIRTLVTSDNCIGRSSGGLPSVARRRALRSGCVSLRASLRLRSTFPARRPQTEAGSFIFPAPSAATRLDAREHHERD
jgi:hypothetical protein